ncbi:hypothetical protein P4V86_03310 [Brevibacillus laterosporus]|uniref:hypothetical protein n=1 Tax=Brevibacillus laterosporus TaxID=1465 RepID=UPI0012DDE9DF|nr:hypothetical protein [Brevibacillus laterosporus]MED2002386.1 hypothetical protein [Brevibacillus laterosporus]
MAAPRITMTFLSKKRVIYKDLTADIIITEYLMEQEFMKLFELGEMYDVAQWIELPEWNEKIAK